jgi:hypothetical protein
MTPPRKFDREVAKRLRADGLTYQAIAVKLGVSAPSVRTGIDPAARAKHREWVLANPTHLGICPTCGGSARNRYRPGAQCDSCYKKEMAGRHVRESTLLCNGCGTWKTDDEFSPTSNEKARRMRHRQCKSCESARRRNSRAIKCEANTQGALV